MVPSSSSSAEPEPQISWPSSKPVQLKNTMRWPYPSSMVALTTPKGNSPRPFLVKVMSGGVPGMARRAPVDRRAPAAGITGDMWAHIDRAQFLNEIGGIVALVGAE